LILTLTVNPAIDRNIAVDRLVFEDRASILATSESAGGRGINASRVIHQFGSKTLAIVPVGGSNSGSFETLLRSIGVPAEIVPVEREIRTNLTISDKQGLTVALNEAGAPISIKELGLIHKAVEKRLSKGDWLMICGSIPPGVPKHFYGALVEHARKKKVQTLVDTDADTLLHTLEAFPATVTPNQQEAERLLNKALVTRTHFLEAAQRIRDMGADSVVLSLGSRGAVAIDKDQMFEAIPPRIDAVCPIGAGDAMAAAFVFAMEKKKTFQDAVRWGVAAGTATAKLPGIAFGTFEQTKEIYEKVEIRPAA